MAEKPLYATTTIELPKADPSDDPIYIRVGDELPADARAVLEQATYSDGGDGPSHLQILTESGALTTDAPVAEQPAEPDETAPSSGDQAGTEDVQG